MKGRESATQAEPTIKKEKFGFRNLKLNEKCNNPMGTRYVPRMPIKKKIDMSQTVTKRVNSIIHVGHAVKVHLVSRGEKTLLRRKMAAKTKDS